MKTSRIELVQESSSLILKIQDYLKEEVKIKEGRNAGDSVLYRSRVYEALNRPISIFPSQESTIIRTPKKKTVFHPMDTSYFSRLESRVHKGCCKRLEIGYFEEITRPYYRRHLLGS